MQSPKGAERDDGLGWMVREVLCRWKHPAATLDMRGTVECWRLRVTGPIPGNPAERGEFIMSARTAGNRPGWDLRPGPDACDCPHSTAPGQP